MLKSRLLSHEIQKQERNRLDSTVSGSFEGTSHWGNQIRSVIMSPHTLVKDHRTGVETTSVQKYLNGTSLTQFIESYLLYGNHLRMGKTID